MRTSRSRLAPAAIALAMLAPAGALACPACFSASSARVFQTYVLTAAGLTLLPLLIVGTFAVWLRRHLRPAPGAGRDGAASPSHSSQA